MRVRPPKLLLAMTTRSCLGMTAPDTSLNFALALMREDPHVTIVDLSRGFGHQKTMMTGLAHVSGDFVLVIDSDLEDEPESGCYLSKVYSEIKQRPYTIVRQVHGGRRNDHPR